MILDTKITFTKFRDLVEDAIRDDYDIASYKKTIARVSRTARETLFHGKSAKGTDLLWKEWVLEIQHPGELSDKETNHLRLYYKYNVFKDLAKGNGAILNALATHYRFHMYQDEQDLRFADAIDKDVFSSPLRNLGTPVFLHPECPRISVGREPENFVSKLCKIDAIQVEQNVESGILRVFYGLSFGVTSHAFGDLIARCGLKGAKIGSKFFGLKVIRYRHADKPLKGRLARNTDTDEFVVMQTCFGAPDPFLRDTVFEEASICDAEGKKDNEESRIQFACSIEFTDFVVEVSSAEVQEFPQFSKEQKEVRKLALDFFIRDRCERGGFEGIISKASWCANDQD